MKAEFGVEVMSQDGFPVLSLFPGIDLLGRAFEEQDYCVVRGPDLLWGGRIERFRPSRVAFDGIIGGSPCQDFSKARRAAPSGEGLRLLSEFMRCVYEAWPSWWLLENVVGVPDVVSRNYRVQRLNVNALECGSRQHRLRCFQFGSLDGIGLVLLGLTRRKRRGVTARAPATLFGSQCDSPASVEGPADTPARTAMASEGRRKDRRDWSEFCQLQGLPADFDLPGMTRSAKYRAVGNGVPLEMGRVIAQAVRHRHMRSDMRVCVCQCGRPVRGQQVHATAACRKRMERRRAAAEGVTGSHPDAATESQEGT